ncbi:MAG TPA: hypothetical protein VF911_19290, partial [Thermoanaerobaculia bacterium]
LYLGNGTLLSEQLAYNAAPVIGDQGPNTLVVWTEDRAVAGAEECKRSLHGAIVTRQGGVLRSFTISQNVLGHARPAVAWNGSAYAVVWESASSNQLVGMLIDAQGHMLSTYATPLTESRARDPYVTAIMVEPNLAWDGSRFVLVWQRLYRTDIPFYPDAPAQYDVRRQYLSSMLTLQGVVEIRDSRGLEPTLATGPERTLIAWRYDGMRNVQIRIVTRETGATIVQRDLGDVDGPLLSAAVGDEFVLIAGTEVFHVSKQGGATAQEPLLPAGAVASDIQVEGERVSIAYTLAHRAYVRVINATGKPGRRRSVGR